MHTRRGAKRPAAAAPEPAAKRTMVESPTDNLHGPIDRLDSPRNSGEESSNNGSETERSFRGDFADDYKINLNHRKIGTRLTLNDKVLDSRYIDEDLAVIMGKKPMKDWEASLERQNTRNIAAGINRAQDEHAEFKRAWRVQETGLKKMWRVEKEEASVIPPPEKRRTPGGQATEDVMNIDVSEDVFRSYQQTLEPPPREVTLYDRTAVGPKVEKKAEVHEQDMTAFHDPFGKRQDCESEVLALLQCVDFEANVVENAGKDVATVAGEELPYPLSKVAFLEEYVVPVFEAVDECRIGDTYNRFKRCEEVAKEVLATVDAADKRWQELVTLSQEVWLDGRNEGLQSPVRTYYLCNKARGQLQRELDKMQMEHEECVFVQFQVELAMQRACRRTESQIESRDIFATDLPEPMSPYQEDKWAAIKSITDKSQMIPDRLENGVGAAASGAMDV